MLKIENSTFEEVVFKFKKTEDKRYEFKIKVTVPENDPLSTISNLMLLVQYDVKEENSEIHRYWFYNKETGSTYGDALLEEEEKMIELYCKKELKIR